MTIIVALSRFWCMLTGENFNFAYRTGSQTVSQFFWFWEPESNDSPIFIYRYVLLWYNKQAAQNIIASGKI